MADPFNATGSDPQNDVWRNLMQFGLATMRAANERDGSGFLKYGAGALGPLGAGGEAAMQQSRDNQLARSQMNLQGAEARSKTIGSNLQLQQLNFQRAMLGLPPLDENGAVPGAGTLRSMNPPQNATGASGSAKPPINSTGMGFSPSAGGMGGSRPAMASAPQESAGRTNSLGIDQDVLSGKRLPSQEEAINIGRTYEYAGFKDLAQKYYDLAMGPEIAGRSEAAKYRAVPQAIDPNKPTFLGGEQIAGQSPDGTPFIMKDKIRGVGQGGDQPLGIRQNNPGNIRSQDGQGYRSYPDAMEGITATAQNLVAYDKKHGLNTVQGIISRWAPPSENDTNSYIQNVSGMLGVAPDQPLDMKNPETIFGLTNAIIQHENGQNPYSEQQVAMGVMQAMGPQAAAAAAPQEAARQASFMPPAGGVPRNAPPAAAPLPTGGQQYQPPAPTNLPPGATQAGPNPIEMKRRESEASKRGQNIAEADTGVANVMSRLESAFGILKRMESISDDVPFGFKVEDQRNAMNQFGLKGATAYDSFQKDNENLFLQEIPAVASAAGGRLDIPLVNAATAATTIPLDANPATKRRLLTQSRDLLTKMRDSILTKYKAETGHDFEMGRLFKSPDEIKGAFQNGLITRRMATKMLIDGHGFSK